MQAVLIEYGALGVAVVAMSAVVYKFILQRMSAEIDSLRSELTATRKRLDQLLATQVADYSEIASTYAEHVAKSRAVISQCTEALGLVLAKLTDEDEE